MQNFIFHNPTKVVFGRGTIAELERLVPEAAHTLVTYGGGSIKRNGVFDQVRSALTGHSWTEFGGIEPNPRYETLMKAVRLAKKETVDFLLAVGGGSVIDGTKFIAAAISYEDGDPWDICSAGAPVRNAARMGCVLTLPGTGSESNEHAVITREATREKLAFSSEFVQPVFAVLDPETTFSLPLRQTQNGIIDAYVHVLEQYLTFLANAPLQDRQAEAILLTLIEEGPKVLADPADYDARANIMWCATQALNGLIACGVPQDWSSHAIGHELTALYGIDHARTLAIVYPAMLRHQRVRKTAKLLQYGERVWGITAGSEEERVKKVIIRTEEFFRSLGARTRLVECDVTEGIERVAERLEKRGVTLGEHHDISGSGVHEILSLCAV